MQQWPLGKKCANGVSAPRQILDLAIGRKAAERLLGELQRAVYGDLKHAPAGSHIGDLGTEFPEPRSRTESPRLVVSLHAVFDHDLHGQLGRLASMAKPESYARPAGGVEPAARYAFRPRCAMIRWIPPLKVPIATRAIA